LVDCAKNIDLRQKYTVEVNPEPKTKKARTASSFFDRCMFFQTDDAHIETRHTE